MSFSVLALQWTNSTIGLLVMIVLFGFMRIPYLIQETARARRGAKLREIERRSVNP